MYKQMFEMPIEESAFQYERIHEARPNYLIISFN